MANQPKPGSGLYPCKTCKHDFEEKDMMIHSSGSVTDFCKKCEAKKRRRGQLRAKKLKGAMPVKAASPAKGKAKTPRGSKIIDYMMSLDQETFKTKEIAEETGDTSTGFTNTRSALACLVKAGAIVKLKRGVYALGDGKTEAEDINTALDKANGVTASLKELTRGFITKFMAMGKTLTKLTLTVDGTRFVVHYEALETGEVVL
jgi:hypothetical protein